MADERERGRPVVAGAELDGEVDLRVPASTDYLWVLRAAAVAVAKDLELDTSSVDLQLATDELCALLLDGAAPGGHVSVRFHHDDDDLYVRMRVERATEAFEPTAPELSRMLLSATVDSYEVRIDGDELVGVLQHALDGAPDIDPHHDPYPDDGSGGEV